MKTNLLKTLLAGALLLAGVSANAQKEKFYVGVTGYDKSANEVTVSATVYDNFAFYIQLPEAGNDVLNAAKAKIDIRMTDVATLGESADEVRSYSNTYDTGVNISDQKLTDWWPKTYALADKNVVSVPVNVIDYNKNKSQEFTYTIAGVADHIIVGTPSSSVDARAAWHIITDNVTTSRPSSNDSYILVPAGTYFQMGNEKITVKEDMNLLEGGWTYSSVAANLQANTEYVDNISGKDVVLYLPAGTGIKMDNSQAILDVPATITFSGTNLTTDELNDNLSTYFNAISGADEANKAKVAIYSFMDLFDKLVGVINSANVVPCTVEFGEGSVTPVDEKVFKVYSIANQRGIKMTKAEFEAERASRPNAIAIVDEADADAVADVENVVVKYAVGGNGNYYYECNKFTLTDRKSGVSGDNIGFYSPVNFTAVGGSYTRNLDVNSNTCCVPFAFTAEQAKGNILSFAYYEENERDGGEKGFYVYFKDLPSISAGVPCHIYCASAQKMEVEFNNTEIVAKPMNDTDMLGQFAACYDYQADYYYGVNAEGNKLATLNNGFSGAFRSVVVLKWDKMFNGGSNHDTTSGAKCFDIAIIDANGEATTIDGVSLGNVNAKEGIYTINGIKVSDMSKPGLYIVNGVKKFVK